VFQRVKNVWFELNITVIFKVLVKMGVKRDAIKYLYTSRNKMSRSNLLNNILI